MLIRVLLWYLLLVQPHFGLISGMGISTIETSLSMPENSPLQDNVWKEIRQTFLKPGDPRTLYPRERHCQPAQESEPKEAIQHDDTRWSFLFSRYTLDAGDELDTWLVNQEIHPRTKDERYSHQLKEFLIPLVFPIALAIFLCACVIVIPIVGAVGFRIVEIIWYIFAHPEIRRTGRRALIMFEKMQRKRKTMLLPDGVSKPPKSQFYLPGFFRLYSGEDIPEELEESEDDEVWLIREEHWEGDEEDDDEEHTKFEAGPSLGGLQIAEEGQGEA